MVSVSLFIFSKLILLLSKKTKSRQKAINVKASVSFIGAEIWMPRDVISTGCMDLHNLMAKKVNGTLTNPIIPKTAEKLAFLLSLTTPLSIRYATYMNQRIRVVVNRGSQVHHTFHTGLAHIGPVTKTIVQNMTPISVEHSAIKSHLSSLLTRKRMLATNVMKKARKAINAEGKWM